MDFTRNKIQFAITDLGGGKLGEKIPMHVHAKDCYELHFVIEGKGTLIADGREIELKNNGVEIQWRYTDSNDWIKLIDLESIRGPAGETPEFEIREGHLYAIYQND